MRSAPASSRRGGATGSMPARQPSRSPPARTPLTAATAGAHAASSLADILAAPSASGFAGLHVGLPPTAAASAEQFAPVARAARQSSAGPVYRSAASSSVSSSAAAAVPRARPSATSQLAAAPAVRNSSANARGVPASSVLSASPTPAAAATPPGTRIRAAPSSAVIAAALQAQMMSSVRVPMPGHNHRSTGAPASAASAIAGAKRRAKATASGGGGGSSSLTLAQQLGLAPVPPPRLTGEQWSAVREKARARGDVDEPCPICQEEFKDSEQVLLSCSHVFHKVCLRNFEKFSGTKVCPICRSKEYEKQLIDDAAIEYRSACATKIQSHWRGWRVRKAYEIMLQTIPPKDAAKRKEFFMNKLQKTSSQLSALMESRESGIDALFADIDRSRAQVRDSLSAAAVQLKSFSDQEWEEIRSRAARRNETECPICMGTFDAPTTAESAAATASSSSAPAAAAPSGMEHAKKRAVLLSCTHTFHHGCLLSFERFALSSLDGPAQAQLSTLAEQQRALEALTDASQVGAEVHLFQPPPSCLCPICRSNYQKTWM